MTGKQNAEPFTDDAILDIEAVEISPMCVGGEQRATLMVMNAIYNLLSRGVFAPRQREVEAELKEKCPASAVNQARISQLMKQLGNV